MFLFVASPAVITQRAYILFIICAVKPALSPTASELMAELSYLCDDFHTHWVRTKLIFFVK